MNVRLARRLLSVLAFVNERGDSTLAVSFFTSVVEDIRMRFLLTVAVAFAVALASTGVKAAGPDQVKPDQVKVAKPDQAKPDHVKHVKPDQVKASKPDQVKACKPDQVKHVKPDQVKVTHAKPDQVKTGYVRYWRWSLWGKLAKLHG
jgi:hypothetical protein